MSIIIKDLNKSYNNVPILENLCLEIKTGSVFGLLGPNGAGKTTLVSILNHLILKDSGNIEIYGLDFEKQKNEIKKISSYIPQTYAFYPNLTSYENLEFFAALYGLKSDKLKKQISYCIEATSLEKFINKRASTYSGGVKRRLNIAIGLLNSPKIIYFDEPTVGIDPQSRKYILEVIKNLNKTQDTTIIYTSHYMEEVEYLCDEIAVLDKNKIILQEKKDVLVKEKSIIEVELDNQKIDVDISNSYDKFLDLMLEIKSKNKNIKNINFPDKKLEKLFLSLTKEDLRD
ncbi:ABC transporter related protein [Arcobacter nitrofigilis DSM 7299]|uniref:ABC transporter related protein n=1 Tax=Arcobacter nitrofigilis (strain ATCC 33309 / DSM 7299 / CCUG 15893 / LMG 7604 / NCTC 12251 / CI) TaxID=572480 RepID=D5V106_ARCNC|nr:ABC transporter ATP-binding protein [Arcobacter nitrofigilis]ADG93968.1 ABC transporter related protein [Arcobacter nitrofigilis DSM 7299]